MPRARTKVARERQKLSRVGRDVVAGLKEAISHARGEIALPSREYEVPGPVDVRAIRARSGLSQSEFAREYGFSVRTLQEWESGGSRPPSAVRAYLVVIDRNPRAVSAALRDKTAA
ncbi:MAG: helix-turn-helix domain-containing protein [Bryobacteraceae bacterium]